MERQFRTQKECKLARDAHILDSPDSKTSQDIERMQTSEGLTNWRNQAVRQVRIRKECKLARGTHSLESQTERQFRTQKECEPARGTHILDGPNKGVSQDTQCEQEIDESTEDISTY